MAWTIEEKKTLRWYEYLCSLLSRGVCLLKRDPAEKMEAAIYLGTLGLSHPRPRGVVEIRASGDPCHFLPKESLNAAGSPFVFSPPHGGRMYVRTHAWMNSSHRAHLPACLCWKHLRRGWNYSHLWLRHHFSVFTRFHIIYSLLFSSFFTRRCRSLLTLRHTFFIVFPPRSLRCRLFGCSNVFCPLRVIESLHVRGSVCVCVCVCVCEREREREKERETKTHTYNETGTSYSKILILTERTC